MLLRLIFRYLFFFLLLALACLVAYLLFDSWRYRNYHEKASQILVGMTKEQVVDIMGIPTQVFGDKISKLHPQNEWCYGKVFGKPADWRFTIGLSPYFWPFRFRYFGCDETDVTIVFGDKKNVSVIIKP